MSKAKQAEIMPSIMPQGDDFRRKALALVGEIGDRFFELGQTLYEIKAGSLYLDWGHASFDEYAEQELNFGRRKADHYVEIWTKLAHELGYEWEQVKTIGWSKLSRVVGVIETKKDAVKWLKLAERHSRRELETLVRDHKAESQPGNEKLPSTPVTARIDHDVAQELAGAADSTAVPFVTGVPEVEQQAILEADVAVDEASGQPLHRFSVMLFPEQWSNVMGAMERAAQVANSNKPGHLLDVIATEFNVAFAATSDGGMAHRLDYYVKLLERLFDVKIDVHVGEQSRLRHMSRVVDEPEPADEPAAVGQPVAKTETPAAPEKGKKAGKSYNW